MRKMRCSLALLFTLVLGLAGCGGGGSQSTTTSTGGGSAPSTPTGTTSAPARVAVVVLENMSYESVSGSSAAPYLNSLAARYAVATSYYANTHPSIGNYFMLTTGQIITNDDAFTGTVSDDNVVRELVKSGKTWKVYAENLPSVGYTGGDAHLYFKHHNPFAYFSDVIGTSQAQNIVPLTQLAADEASGGLPSYSFIVPNFVDDGHDCPNGGTTCTVAERLAVIDGWLQANIAPLLASSGFSSNGTIIITWDESDATDKVNGGGHVMTLVIGPKVKQGYRSTTSFQHQSVLRFMMESIGVSSVPGAGASAASMSEFFN